jgi:2-polyprenyl-3-methyl-5-hydroxy-6-metoxy-1,4-benzoquinol methylase
MATQALDQAKASAFGEKMVDVLNCSALGLMTSIGHRTGLFDTMGRMPPARSHQIAERANLSERYVREWLGAMVSGGVIEYDPQAETYRLPPEHAAWLTRDAVPQNVASSTQWIAVLGEVEDAVVEAFRHGNGVPYSAYRRFHPVMAEESDQTVVAGLAEHILPLEPSLPERLSRGIDAVDVGCGSGRAVMAMASLYPQSRFCAMDFSAEAIGAARQEAARRGLRNVRFEVQDLAVLDAQRQYDLVTAFDVIHDQAQPAAVLRNIARALKPDGIFLMQDIAMSSFVHNNVGSPLSAFIYTISCMHCMSVSLACNGAGLGAAWGREKALQMLREAGFGNVRIEELPHDNLNYYYLARLAS